MPLDRYTLLIDGDIAAYKATTRAEIEVQWCDDADEEGELWLLWTDLAKAKLDFENYLAHIEEATGAEQSIIYLSSPSNFRKDVWPQYKGNRKDVRKPLGFTPFRKWLVDEWGAKIMPGVEADDAMGIAATSGKYKHPLIVSDDKDLQQIPGKLYRCGQVVTITPRQADFYFLQQTLTGDATDGYPGCPGIGEKRAYDALMQDASWDTVVKLYEKADLTEEDALVQARLARILRYSDYDHKKKEVKLWHPQTG